MSSDLASIFAEKKHNDPDAEKWCQTKTNVVKLNYVWTIDEFKLSEKVFNYKLASAIFSTPRDKGTTWQLILHSNEHRREICQKGLYMGFYLSLKSSTKPNVPAQFQISVYNRKLKKYEKLPSKYHIFGQDKDNIAGSSHSLHRSDLIDEGKGFLSHGKLTIFCKISVVADVSITTGETDMMNETPECSLSDNLGNVLENGILSDVTLVVNKREFKCHKVILSAQSVVFEAMFRHEMEEQIQNRVKINDMDHRVMEEMLKFIYTDKTTNLDEMADKLLAAANKYCLKKLKFMCEKALFQRMTIENVAEVLIFADLHNTKQLKANAINFMNINKQEVSKTASYKSVIESHPHLIVEAFTPAAMYDSDEENN